MQIKYLCIGGTIISNTDGDEHYISPQRVAELYKVNLAECIFARDVTDEKLFALRYKPDLICLRPRTDGNYNL